MPQTPYPVSGTVFTSRGTVENSIVRINSDIQVSTDSKGNFLLDLANMSENYSDGESYIIEAWDSFNNEYISDTITVTGGSQTKNLFLIERDTAEGDEIRRLTPIILKTIGNKNISLNNPLIIQTMDKPLSKKMFKVPGTNKTEYICEAVPGTPSTASKWRIKKLFYSGNFVNNILWANGNAEFDKIADNRGSYSYG